MRLWVLACLLAVCLVVSNAKRGSRKRKNERENSDVVKTGNGALQGKNNSPSMRFAVPPLFAHMARNRNKNNKDDRRSKTRTNSNRRKKSKKDRKSKSKSKSRSKSRSRSKKRGRKSCRGGFNFFSFLKLFGLRRNNTGDPQDDAVCQELSHCTLLAFGRLALRDCLERLQEVGQTLEPSVPTGDDLDGQIGAVTTDLRACMALLDTPVANMTLPDMGSGA